MSAPAERATDVLSEPPASRFLRVLRRELSLSLMPELQSARARGVAELMQSVLDHLIARQEHLPELEAQFETTKRYALQALTADQRGNSDEAALAQLVGQIEARSALHAVLAAERDLHDALEGHEKNIVVTALAPDEQPGLDAASLQTYLRCRFGEALYVADIRTPMGGYSKDTFIVGLRGSARPADGIVIRCDLAGGPLETTATSELGVLQAMHAAGVPVAEPLWAEADPRALGRPFIAVKQVAGRQLMDMRLEFSGDNAADCARQMARVLARVHQVDPSTTGIDEKRSAQTTRQHIVALLDQFEDQWHRRRLGPSPAMAAGFAWMRANIPEQLPSARVVHGDATLRNMLFDGSAATALLDWETWHLGDPAEDLAYCRDEVQRFVDWNQFLAEYHDAGGPAVSDESLHYWGMWMYLRGAVTSTSQMDRLLDEPPPDIRPAFGGPHFTRYCVRKVADFLLHC